jgi:hypothetical protein
MNGTTVHQDDFDAVLLAELETLRESEQRLERLYRRLRRKPHLRESFLCVLSEVQQRAERLDAVLNPLEFFKAPALPLVGPSLMPAA